MESTKFTVSLTIKHIKVKIKIKFSTISIGNFLKIVPKSHQSEMNGFKFKDFGSIIKH